MPERAPSLRDRTGFWLAIAGVLAVIGGTPLLIASTASITLSISPWSSSWFIFGFAILVVAGFCVLWSVVLYVAHHHAEGHWCPDPEAHVVPPPTVRTPPQQPLPDFPPQSFVYGPSPVAGETPRHSAPTIGTSTIARRNRLVRPNSSSVPWNLDITGRAARQHRP